MLKIHHIGIVVKNIALFIENSDYNISSEIVYDKNQHSNICLLNTLKNEPIIELIEPIDEKSTTYNHLIKNGNGIHHLCYQIESWLMLKGYLSRKKIKVIMGPVKALIFKNQRVVFGYSPIQGLVEFIILDKQE